MMEREKLISDLGWAADFGKRSRDVSRRPKRFPRSLELCYRRGDDMGAKLAHGDSCQNAFNTVLFFSPFISIPSRTKPR